VHPRVGAADVVPVVPVRPADMARAKRAALALAERVGGELDLPVFVYGELAPEFGPARIEERSGAVLVGARRPLIAFNVNLRGELESAREISSAIRERDGGFPGVRALGLELPRAGLVQVSMNVEDWEAAALHDLIAGIEREAAARGAEVVGSELVGLMPGGAAAAAAGAALRIDGFDASRVLELRLLEPDAADLE
jgi:glutamate formiminotransferase/glutamate formiminotransferase/formiminotetrahydrofolate cyclodeaminase